MKKCHDLMAFGWRKTQQVSWFHADPGQCYWADVSWLQESLVLTRCNWIITALPGIDDQTSVAENARRQRWSSPGDAPNVTQWRFAHREKHISTSPMDNTAMSVPQSEQAQIRKLGTRFTFSRNFCTQKMMLPKSSSMIIREVGFSFFYSPQVVIQCCCLLLEALSKLLP